MKKIKNNEISLDQALLPIIYIILAIILEIINFTTLGYTTKAQHTQFLPNYFIFDFLMYVFIASIIFFINKRWVSNTIFLVSLSFQLIFNIITATLKNANGTILSLEQLLLIGEGLDAFSIDFIDFKSFYINLIILFISIFMILFSTFIKNIKINIKNKFYIGLAIFLSAFIFCFSSFFVVPLTMRNISDYKETAIIDSDKVLWKNLTFQDEAHRRFGTVGYYTKSIFDNMFNKNNYNINKEEYLNIIKENETEINTNAKLYGDNVIFLMLESYDTFAIDPYNTPTLYKFLNNDSVYFNNYFSDNKTNVVEYISLLGYTPTISLNAMPLLDTLEINNQVSMKYALPKLFKQLDYNVNYFHCYDLDFYNRVNINKGFGFDNLYDMSYMGKETPEFFHWYKEKDFFNAVQDYMVPSDGNPFMSFYLTISTHGEYANSISGFEEYYSEYDNNLENFKTYLEEELHYTFPTDETNQKYLREFKARAIDTEKMFNALLEKLNNTEVNGEKLINNTTIVLFADHNAYYEKLTETIKGNKFYDLFNVPFAIYSSKLTPEINEKFTFLYDIYPTVCNLFGLSYNKFMCFGNNIFSDEVKYNIFYSHTVGFFNDKVYSNNLKDYENPYNLSQDYIKNFKLESCKIMEKQLILQAIYRAGW